ncbi:MAG: hypothetical protein AAF791_06800 [Bacteroidota bacterium]
MPRSLSRLALVLSLAASGGCSTDAERTEPDRGAASVADDPRARTEAETADAPPAEPGTTAPTVFDAANAVFDTLEPPPRSSIEIREPVEPDPRQPPPPAPEPVPDPAPLPPPSPAPPVAGSCDVRGTENYCFTYTGAAWSASSAEEHCAAAPDAAYEPAECPEDGRIATCVFRRGETPSREIVYTYYEPYDLALARIACPGRFTEE